MADCSRPWGRAGMTAPRRHREAVPTATAKVKPKSARGRQLEPRQHRQPERRTKGRNDLDVVSAAPAVDVCESAAGSASSIGSFRGSTSAHRRRRGKRVISQQRRPRASRCEVGDDRRNPEVANRVFAAGSGRLSLPCVIQPGRDRSLHERLMSLGYVIRRLYSFPSHVANRNASYAPVLDL